MTENQITRGPSMNRTEIAKQVSRSAPTGDEGSQMKNETHEILNGMLADWHRWAKGYQHVGGINTSPMFREVKAGRAWDTVDQIIDTDIEHSRMEALDHIIMGLRDVYRTALQIQAMNLYTGRSVWSSARLPVDAEAMALILVEARAALLFRLRDAGIV